MRDPFVAALRLATIVSCVALGCALSGWDLISAGGTALLATGTAILSGQLRSRSSHPIVLVGLSFLVGGALLLQRPYLIAGIIAISSGYVLLGMTLQLLSKNNIDTNTKDD